MTQQSYSEYIKEASAKELNDMFSNSPFPSTNDSIVDEVIEKFRSRSAVGLKKYGHTLDRKDLSKAEWVNHLQEELMDAILYVTRLKKELTAL